MKKILLSAPIIFFLLTLGFLYRGLENDPKHLPSALIGKNIPTFELRTLDAENVLTQEQLLGQPFLLNVWATWCYACRIEHPMLVELSKRGVKIIGLNYKDQESLAGDWLDDKGDPYIFSIFDPDGKLGFDLGVYGAPETYLVDAHGISCTRE